MMSKAAVFAAVCGPVLVLAQTQVSQRDEADLTPAEVTNQQQYNQPLRPQFHYTPIQGHLGDATGLIYYRGEYHLFYMYDEWSRKRLAHKQWGHAVSNDLVHWKQLPGLLDNLVDNRPGSGSGVVDWNDSSKLRTGREKALIIFYTDYKLGTCIASSQDRGRTWARYSGNPIIAGAEDARDPTVFWYAPANQWRMVRYEKKGFAFYKSDDLIHWNWLSRVEGYYECPDLFELPVVNQPEKRQWVLIDGDASYVIGNFDGQKFVPETEKLKVDYGTALYATQTWKRTMDPGPAVQIAWMRYPMDKSITWNGQMSFPVELTLRQFPQGVRLCRQPIDELNNLRVQQIRSANISALAGSKQLSDVQSDLLDVQIRFGTSTAKTISMRIHGHSLVYSRANHKLRLDSFRAPLTGVEDTLTLRILVDRSSLKVFADHGEATLSEITLDNSDQKIDITAEGGAAQIELLEINKLESIW